MVQMCICNLHKNNLFLDISEDSVDVGPIEDNDKKLSLSKNLELKNKSFFHYYIFLLIFTFYNSSIRTHLK